MKNFYRFVGLSALLVGWLGLSGHYASALTRQIVFPVLGPVSYNNDFGAPRVGHTHEGNDLLGQKMQPLLAAVDGTARYVAFPEPNYGWYISLEDSDGYSYVYIHTNNDTPGTDDNRGGANFAYAPSVDNSWPVVAGQVIAYMGDSGNAEHTHPHLHFEIRTPDDVAINPFFSLQVAKKLTQPVTTPSLPFELLPYSQFKVGSNIASGDLAPEFPGNELVVGAGPGSPPQVRIITSNGSAAGNFFLAQKTFRGGVDVAVGDVNGDGVQDIVTGLGPGDQPLVQIHDRHGVVLSQFLAYTAKFRGGVRVSTADLDGDGVAEIITGAGRGGSPDVRVYRMNGDLVTSFYAYTPRFRGGVDVAGVSATDQQLGRIVTAPAAGGGPDVRVFNANGGFANSFWSGDSTFHGGLRVTTAWDDQTNQTVIFTVPMSAGQGVIRQLSLNGAVLNEQNVFERWWTGGFDVTVADRVIYTSSAYNNRRGSIMKTDWSTGFNSF